MKKTKLGDDTQTRFNAIMRQLREKMIEAKNQWMRNLTGKKGKQ
jgi:hypothetical protein